MFSAVTGACFFVFSGALKASSGFLAKTSIVEGENCDNKVHVGWRNAEILVEYICMKLPQEGLDTQKEYCPCWHKLINDD